MSSKKTKFTKKQIVQVASLALASVFVLIAAAIVTVGTVVHAEPGRVLKGVHVAGVDIGSRTHAEAEAAIQAELEQYALTFSFNDRQAAIRPFVAEPSHPPVASLNVAAAMAAAERVGTATTLTAWLGRAQTYFFGNDVGPAPTLDEDGLQKWLEASFGDHVTAPKGAHFATNADGTLAINEGVAGEQLLFDAAVRTAKRHTGLLSPTNITIGSIRARPAVEAANLAPFQAKAAAAVAAAPVTFRSGTHTTVAKAADVAGWLTIGGNGQLAVDHDRLQATVFSLAEKVAEEPKNAEYQEKDGRAVRIIPDVPGKAVDLDTLATVLGNILLGDTPTAQASVDVPLKDVHANVRLADVNPYGISEVIGIGESNFAGSPVNRRHNIAVGRDSINGVVIQPGETFSLIGALGAIDASTGYRTELVIKGDKTTPEYGGGLCQIGTTLFRAALDAGLSIPERRNHSYRVSYYEKAGDGSYMGPGKDATIYDPSPDLKITNDTGTAIILQTVSKGDRLTFTFWGKKDGRVASQTDAKILSTTPAPPPKLIPSPDLKPGEKKCTEKPHAGAQVVFTYSVTHADGRVDTKDFLSTYRPWGEVCLVGIDPNAPPLADPNATLPSADAAGTTGA
jgi:vancomycin resistance protein YoaR